MAGDLIPPPSPAGRPDPDALRAAPETNTAPQEEPGAEDLVLRTRPDDPATGMASEEPPAGPSPYRSRFGFVIGALLGVGVAAVAITVALIAGGGPGGDRATQWSPWQPTAEDTFTAAAEIAGHVGRKYRHGDGSQLVAVQSGPIAVRDVPLQVVVRTSPIGGDIIEIRGSGVQYTFNGLGPRGSIKGGKPSTERLALLKREALELALYTFRYIEDVDHVVTLLPPPPPEEDKKATGSGSTSETSAPSAQDETPLTAMLFRPGDLEAQLEAPLELTIPPATPRPENFAPRDAKVITDFTAGNVFTATVQPDQVGSGFLVLERPEALVSGLPADGGE